MTRGQAIAARYAGFAIVAIAANLGTQAALLAAVPEPTARSAILLAVAAGTCVGLIAKYILDKHYIFEDPSSGLIAQSRSFALYTMTGVLTTAIFWATELAASLFDPGGPMMYAAGGLGLTVGYWLKYHLDRRFTFSART